MNLYLIGYRGTGKTTLGQAVAEASGRRFADTDSVVQTRWCMTIREMVRRSGWERFRCRETAVLRDVSRHRGLIVATGGGIVLAEANIACMRASGTVLWLQAEPRTIAERLQRDPASFAQRPRLSADSDAVAEVAEVLAARRARYHAAHHHAVATDGASVGELVAWVTSRLPGWQARWERRRRPH